MAGKVILQTRIAGASSITIEGEARGVVGDKTTATISLKASVRGRALKDGDLDKVERIAQRHIAAIKQSLKRAGFTPEAYIAKS